MLWRNMTKTANRSQFFLIVEPDQAIHSEQDRVGNGGVRPPCTRQNKHPRRLSDHRQQYFLTNQSRSRLRNAAQNWGMPLRLFSLIYYLIYLEDLFTSSFLYIWPLWAIVLLHLLSVILHSRPNMAFGSASSPKRLVICVDGTWCTPDGPHG